MNAVLGRITSTAQELAHYHSGDGIVVYYLLVVFPHAGSLNIFRLLRCLVLICLH